MKSVYQANQQVKLLHLEAEIDSLLLQLQQALKQQQLVGVTTAQKSISPEHN